MCAVDCIRWCIKTLQAKTHVIYYHRACKVVLHHPLSKQKLSSNANCLFDNNNNFFLTTPNQFRTVLCIFDNSKLWWNHVNQKVIYPCIIKQLEEFYDFAWLPKKIDFKFNLICLSLKKENPAYLTDYLLKK